MTNLIDGGTWWATVEQKGRHDGMQYWKVIAWERVEDAFGETRGAMVAWINGRDPVRSDQFVEQVPGWTLYNFVDSLPENATISSWS